jgi:hypothetical protein
VRMSIKDCVGYRYQTNRRATLVLRQEDGASYDCLVLETPDGAKQAKFTLDPTTGKLAIDAYQQGVGSLPIEFVGPVVFDTATAHIGGLTRVGNAANSSVSYTGVGFKPSAIEFMVEGGGFAVCHGFATAVAQRASANEAGVSQGTVTDACVYITTAGATQWLKGSLTSMDADGFTIAWTHSGLGATTFNVSYKATR